MEQLVVSINAAAQTLGLGRTSIYALIKLKRIEAIINSMTKEERRNDTIINGSRRKRIALGSGTNVADVNRFLKQYAQTKKMMKKFTKMGPGGLGRFTNMLPG